MLTTEIRLVNTPDNKNHLSTPIISHIGPAINNPIGVANNIILFTIPITRPKMLGSIELWINT